MRTWSNMKIVRLKLERRIFYMMELYQKQLHSRSIQQCWIMTVVWMVIPKNLPVSHHVEAPVLIFLKQTATIMINNAKIMINFSKVILMQSNQISKKMLREVGLWSCKMYDPHKWAVTNQKLFPPIQNNLNNYKRCTAGEDGLEVKARPISAKTYSINPLLW